MTDNKEIEVIIKEVIARHGKAVDDFKKGKENSLQFLIGQVMAQARGRANPDLVKELLKKILTEKYQTVQRNFLINFWASF
jgi:aspartyl-tRNA(Asn)/glutamyl-tRNA(Gln) amidotransferase subunit B